MAVFDNDPPGRNPGRGAALTRPGHRGPQPVIGPRQPGRGRGLRPPPGRDRRLPHRRLDPLGCSPPSSPPGRSARWGSPSIASVRRRRREFALLKTLGFTQAATGRHGGLAVLRARDRRSHLRRPPRHRLRAMALDTVRPGDLGRSLSHCARAVDGCGCPRRDSVRQPRGRNSRPRRRSHTHRAAVADRIAKTRQDRPISSPGEQRSRRGATAPGKPQPTMRGQRAFIYAPKLCTVLSMTECLICATADTVGSGRLKYRSAVLGWWSSLPCLVTVGGCGLRGAGCRSFTSRCYPDGSRRQRGGPGQVQVRAEECEDAPAGVAPRPRGTGSA